MRIIYTKITNIEEFQVGDLLSWKNGSEPGKKLDKEIWLLLSIKEIINYKGKSNGRTLSLITIYNDRVNYYPSLWISPDRFTSSAYYPKIYKLSYSDEG